MSQALIEIKTNEKPAIVGWHMPEEVPASAAWDHLSCTGCSALLMYTGVNPWDRSTGPTFVPGQ